MSFEDVSDLKEKIEKRKALEKKRKVLKRMLPKEEQGAGRIGVKELDFKTKVRTGRQLKSQIAITREYKKRECIRALREYIFGPVQDRVLIIYGLRRTGKTTMIRQILTELSPEEFKYAA